MTMRTRLLCSSLLVLAGLVPASVHAQIDSGLVPLQTARTELARFRERYADNYNQKNVAALTAMFGENAIVIMPDGAMLHGRAEIGASLKQQAPTSGHMVITSDTTVIYGNTAIDAGTVAIHPSGGGEQLSRYLVVLRRGYKDWSLIRVSQTMVDNDDD